MKPLKMPMKTGVCPLKNNLEGEEYIDDSELVAEKDEEEEEEETKPDKTTDNKA